MKLDQLKPRNSLVIGHFVLIKEAVSAIFTVKKRICIAGNAKIMVQYC